MHTEPFAERCELSCLPISMLLLRAIKTSNQKELPKGRTEIE